MSEDHDMGAEAMKATEDSEDESFQGAYYKLEDRIYNLACMAEVLFNSMSNDSDARESDIAVASQISIAASELRECWGRGFDAANRPAA